MNSEDNEVAPVKDRSAVTDAKAIKVFNQALDWAEKSSIIHGYFNSS